MNYIISLYAQEKETLAQELIKNLELDSSIYSVSANRRQSTNLSNDITIGIERLVVDTNNIFLDLFNLCNLKDEKYNYLLSVGTSESALDSIMKEGLIYNLNLDTSLRSILDEEGTVTKKVVERLEFRFND